MTTAGRLLDHINAPEDLRRLPLQQLPQLALELREEIIRVVSEHGGHFASSLGAVELVTALHYAFETPRDMVLWDMGYQAYAHKLLTGRKDRFHTIKQLGGLSGFNSPDESPYDLFATGHGGTVISTALGLATARDLAGQTHKVVAVLGDASLGEGMALEALNHVGHDDQRDMLVVLNDNRWSISPSVGALSKYLNRVLTGPLYNRVRDDFESLMHRVPKGDSMLKVAKRLEENLKGFLTPGLLFEELGFHYFGPVDGHDFPALVSTLRNVSKMRGPVLVHVVTKKGKGYAPAEADPERFHKTEPFDVATGQVKGQGAGDGGRGTDGSLAPRPSPLAPASFTEAFSESLVQLAERDQRIVAISAAMLEGTGLDRFAKQFPARCVDVGMAEQHGLGLAAGLARGGARPVVALYSTFLQRAYDQVFHELCLQRLPVILAIDRGGIVGEDGPTHHGLFDIAYLRHLPGIAILSPAHEAELAAMLAWAFQQPTPVAIRYARGASGFPVESLVASASPIALGCGEVLCEGTDVALVALGSMVTPALAAAHALGSAGISAAVINARFAKPLDEALLLDVLQRYPYVVTLEEGVLDGGFGSAVLEWAEQRGLRSTAIKRIGVPCRFIEHGRRALLLERLGLTGPRLAATIAGWVRSDTSMAERSVT